MQGIRIVSIATVALAAIFSTAFLSGASARMRFSAVTLGDAAQCGNRCPVVIQAEGSITREAADDFVAFAKDVADRGGLINIVLIHSPGGSVVGSMLLGSTFRTLGTTVIVARVNRGGGFFSAAPVDARTGKAIPQGALTNASCNSACVYAVMGGKRRVIPDDSRMGVHRMQTESNYGFDPVTGRVVVERRTGTTDVVQALKLYTRYMGVDPKLIDLAESIPHEDIRILSTNQVRSFKLGVPKLRR